MFFLIDLLEAEGRVNYAFISAPAVQAYVQYRCTHDLDVAVEERDL